MARIRPFTRGDIDQRARLFKDECALTPERFKPLADLGHIPKARRPACLAKIQDEFRYAAVRQLTEAQERPARRIAALKLIEEPAKQLAARLRDLPMSDQLELRSLMVEPLLHELTRDAVQRIGWLQQNVNAHRPANAHFREWLYQDIEAIGREFSPDHLGKNERLRRQWTADVLRGLGMTIPNEKKNRTVVTGKRAPRRSGPEFAR